MDGPVIPPYPHGIHVAPVPLEPYEKLTWYEPGRSNRYRVREHTCECTAKGEFYEFCSSGGLMFIRRTDRDYRQTLSVRESERWQTKRAEEIWLLLIMGRVF